MLREGHIAQDVCLGPRTGERGCLARVLHPERERAGGVYCPRLSGQKGSDRGSIPIPKLRIWSHFRCVVVPFLTWHALLFKFTDIDDTIKVSNVLDTKALLRSTFLEEPKAVPGMPELYSSLAKSLQSPQFVYVSGSPHQLYPFLNKFVDTTFVDAKGPILLKPLTVDNMPQVIKILTDPQHTIDYKTAMIDRVADMYTQKKWVLIGDSGQQDPEIYAAAWVFSSV